MNHTSERNDPSGRIIGSTPAILELRSQLIRLATFDVARSPHVPTVLICGETGTGKGLVARTLHDCGPRAAGPFIDVNCAAIPETMLEAELFGFEEGAFTDAKRAKPGLFEAAAGGSLFLDEIDSCPFTLQSKLLKVIEDKSARRLGSLAAHAVDAKLIAASQRDLGGLAAGGRFRADLYHRLAVVVLQLPTLRERADDIVPLAEHYIGRYADAHGQPPKRITADGAEWLRAHQWPGNVRELSHLMERVTLLATSDEIDAATLEKFHLPTPMEPQASPPRTAPTLVSPQPASEPDDADEIRDALRQAGGNVAGAARVLGIGRNALRYRMRRYGIERPNLQELPQATPAVPAHAPVAGAAAAIESGKAQIEPAAPVMPSAVTPSWEERPAAILAIEIVTSTGSEGGIRSDPWTLAKKWQTQVVADRVHGFGGTLLQATPSRCTAIFGVPKALEQYPHRAVQCGLAILRHVAEEAEHGRAVPQVRIAAHLGSVQFDSNATDLAAALLPDGDTLVLPDRLLAHTADREILISAQVGRRIEKNFELAERSVRLAGASDHTEVFAVSAATRRTGPDSRSGLGRFVGRRRELDLLSTSFARARSGNGQVAFIVGDAGMGKSRLVQEFRDSLADEPHVWIEGRCAAYGSTTAFLPIIDALRRHLGIDDRDAEAAAMVKIDAKIADLGQDLEWTKPFIQRILSIRAGDGIADLDPGRRRSETFRALQATALRESERSPLVICIEDLHWIDKASEEFLVFLAESLPAARVLLLCSHRPGYQHPFGDRSYHQRLALGALSPTETADMAGATLGVASIPREVEELIAEKAEGNPFFIEEVTASLLEDGSLHCENGKVQLTRTREEISVPDTIQDVLIARIDRLADESRHAIQIASVIGREFALRLLERITETGEQLRGQINELRSLELIYEKAMHPELAYMFKHALTHDVAYKSVHHQRRTDLHRIIGRAIEELYADRLAEHYETLAHHFSEGHDLKRALHYHICAAEKAADGHANRSVVHHCEQGLSIAAKMGEAIDDPTLCNLEERRALALFYLSEFGESGRAYERAAARAGDPHERSFLLSSAGLSFFWEHDYDNANRLLTSAAELSTTHDDPAGLSVVEFLSSTYEGIINGDLDAYEKRCGDALRLQKASGSEIAEALGCFARSEFYEWTGQYEQAIAIADRGVELGKKLRLSHLIIWPMWFGAKARCCLGLYGEALARLHEAADICGRIGDRAWNSRMLNTLGWCYAEIGAHDIATTFNERAAAIAREFGDPEIIANSEINLALNRLEAGDVDRAGELVAPIASELQASTDPWMRWRFSLHVANAQARIAIAGNDLDTALRLADEQIEGARQHKAPKIEARGITLRGQVLLSMDKRDEARKSLTDAAAVAERIRYSRTAAEILCLASEADRRDGKPADAEEKAARARSILTGSAQSLTDDNLRQRLLASLD